MRVWAASTFSCADLILFGYDMAGSLPGRASAGSLSVKEEEEGYLQKARAYIENLGAILIVHADLVTCFICYSQVM